MGRVSVPDAREVASRWEEGARGSGNRFANAAVDASDTWLENASSDQAQENYETAMADQEVLARRQANTDDTARTKFEERLNAFGASRYQSGVSAGTDDFETAIGEVLGAIDGLDIPDRGRPLSQANQDRALQVQRALNEAGGGT